MSLWPVIVASGLITYLTRAAGLVLDARGSLPASLRRYVDALPTAIIAALVGRGVLAPNDALTRGAEPLAAVAVVAVVAWRRDLLAGTITGIVTIALLRAAGVP